MNITHRSHPYFSQMESSKYPYFTAYLKAPHAGLFNSANDLILILHFDALNGREPNSTGWHQSFVKEMSFAKNILSCLNLSS